jgi:hypothetical protein
MSVFTADENVFFRTSESANTSSRTGCSAGAAAVTFCGAPYLPAKKPKYKAAGMRNNIFFKCSLPMF